MAKKKLGPGRGSVIERKFRELLTNPSEYTALPKLIRTDIKNCELCGMAIEYSFALRHEKDIDFKRGKSLWVGGDCIVSYAEYRGFNENLIQEMILTMRKLIGSHKKDKFKKKYPRFDSDIIYLNEQIKALSFKYYSAKSLLSKSRIHPLVRSLKQSTSDFKRNGYTSEPNVKKVLKLKRQINSGLFEIKLKEHHEIVGSKKTISAELSKNKKHKSFYEKYLKFSGSIQWEFSPSITSRALSTLEKESFLEKYTSYKKKLKRMEKRAPSL